MNIHFLLRYTTRLGESFSIVLPDGQVLPLEYLNDDFWHVIADIDAKSQTAPGYRYVLYGPGGQVREEMPPGRGIPVDIPDDTSVTLLDYFNPAGLLENTFGTQPFQDIFFRGEGDAQVKIPARYTHIFRVKAPQLKPDEVLCLLGHSNALRNWDTAAPLLLFRNAALPGGDVWWEARIDLSAENFPLGYKYGVWNTRTNRFMGFEEGTNRTILPGLKGAAEGEGLTVHHDNFARFPLMPWRGAGVAIPVFSLRSSKSFGVGEFTDLPLLADWAKSIGLKIIQILPINDTSATATWADCYPYAAISAFALHPQYLNVAEVAGKAQAALLKPYARKQKELNALAAVDYEAVMQQKWTIIRQLFAAQKAGFLTNTDFLQYFTENKHWLVPYAAFCFLRDQNNTPDFNQWSSNTVYQEKEIEKLVSSKSAHYDEVAIHYYVQWHLHRQLKAAADYIHAQGLALKGDIPIGIYRFSCDAWVAPELYNMSLQAGAPPDDFAVNGQNWGFPTYNWERMKADGFAWWRQRFQQMRLYFDAFRIDHILGFFRIWSIPMDAVEGILGYFMPALPVTEAELREAGIGFNYERLCKPFITDAVLWELFGEQADTVREQFLDLIPGGSQLNGSSQYRFKPGFDTQRKVEVHLRTLSPEPALKRVDNEPLTPEQLEKGLFALLTNVILLGTRGETAEGAEWEGAFRFGIENTASFKYLPIGVKEPLKALYVDYFYSRQDDFWRQEAMEKLPALKRSTNMLICGEDLGMVPHCVPNVMEELGILSLEIQRMPKKTGAAFFHPKDAPYLSVVTPSTHDMSTIRGWWEEDHNLTQRFFNEVLGYEGAAPYFCEPWVNRLLVEQHLHSPAMWAIFQLQDLMGIDGELRWENPNDERINVPANPRHYWRYRMHIALEELQKSEEFNTVLHTLVRSSGR